MRPVQTGKPQTWNMISDWKCPLSSWRYINLGSAKVEKVDCKQWTCAEHGELVRWRWQKRASLVKWTLMWTFTQVPEDQAVARRCWHAVRRRLKRSGVTTYLRALEIGSGGTRHWHVLVAGPTYMRRRGWDGWLQSVGLGPINDVKRVIDQDGAARYVTKYVTKGNEHERHEARLRGWRRVTVSRDIPTWKRLHEILSTHTRTDDSGSKWRVSRNNYLPVAHTSVAGERVVDSVINVNNELTPGMVLGGWRRKAPVHWAERILLDGRIPGGGLYDASELVGIARDQNSATSSCRECSWRVAGGKHLHAGIRAGAEDAGIDDSGTNEHTGSNADALTGGAANTVLAVPSPWDRDNSGRDIRRSEYSPRTVRIRSYFHLLPGLPDRIDAATSGVDLVLRTEAERAQPCADADGGSGQRRAIGSDTAVSGIWPVGIAGQRRREVALGEDQPV